jgi:acetyltransferase-like isoleucine patch superfamily enzyme
MTWNMGEWYGLLGALGRRLRAAGGKSTQVRSLMARIGARGRAMTSTVLADQVASGVVSIGAQSYGSPRIHAHRGDTTTVSIGAFVSIADEVEIFLGGNHRTDWVSTFPFRMRWDLPGAGTDGHPASRGDVRIGNDVWIARGAKILSGVTIGNGAVVGAYSVVTRDVAAYAVVAGVPARELRRRFGPGQIAALEAIAWWDWPLDQIRAEVARLSSDNIDDFIDRYREAGAG